MRENTDQNTSEYGHFSRSTEEASSGPVLKLKSIKNLDKIFKMKHLLESIKFDSSISLIKDKISNKTKLNIEPVSLTDMFLDMQKYISFESLFDTLYIRVKRKC